MSVLFSLQFTYEGDSAVTQFTADLQDREERSEDMTKESWPELGVGCFPCPDLADQVSVKPGAPFQGEISHISSCCSRTATCYNSIIFNI